MSLTIVAQHVERVERERTGEAVNVLAIGDEIVAYHPDGSVIPVDSSAILRDLAEQRPDAFQVMLDKSPKRGVSNRNAMNLADRVERNPWFKGQDWNMTNQALITRGDPDRAAKLKAEAGIS